MISAVLEIPNYAVWGIALVLVGAIVAQALRVSRERHNARLRVEEERAKAEEERRVALVEAKDRFAAIIDPLITSLRAKPIQNSPKAVWHNSFDQLKGAVEAFSKELPPSERVGFEEAWRCYRTIDRSLLEHEMIKLFTGSMGLSYERGLSTILPRLDALRNYAR